jgi:hypothetical protein
MWPSSSQLPSSRCTAQGLGVARLELAGDGLDQVLQRDDALHLAVLVDHEGHVHAVRKLSSSSMPVMVSGTYSGACSRPGRAARRAARDSHWRALTRPRVHAAAHDREARVVDSSMRPGSLPRLVDVQAHHVGARHHQRADLAVVQAEHVAHHGVLVRLDHAGAGALGQRRGFLPRSPALPWSLHAQQAQQRLVEPDSSARRAWWPWPAVDGARHQAGHGLGVDWPRRLGTSSPSTMEK